MKFPDIDLSSLTDVYHLMMIIAGITFTLFLVILTIRLLTNKKKKKYKCGGKIIWQKK